MLRRRDFIRIVVLSGLGFYVESTLPAFGKLIANQSENIENLHLALNIAKSIEDRAYSARAVCKVAEGFYNVGEKEFSDALAIKALKMSFQAGKKKDFALNAVGEYYLKSNNLKKTLHIINIMDEQGIMKYSLLLRTSFFAYKKGDMGLSDRLLSIADPNCCPIYLEKLPEKSFLEWLERVYQICKKTYYTKYLASSWLRIGDAVKGRRYLEEVWNFSPADAIKIGVSYLTEEDIRILEKRIFSLDDKYQKIESLFYFAEYYIQKDPERAGALITFCKEVIDSDTPPEQYAVLGRLLVRNGSIKEGKKYLSFVPEMVINKYCNRDPEDLIHALSHYLDELLVEYILAGWQDEIPGLLSELEAKGIKYDEPLWYPGIVTKAKEKGYREEAICFLENEIRRVSDKNLPDKINALSEIAASMFVIGEKERGIAITKNVIKYLERLLSDKDVSSRIDFAYLSEAPYFKNSNALYLDAVPRLALQAAINGFAREAVIITNMVDDKDLTDDVYYRLVGYLTKEKRYQEAFKMANEIKESKQKDRALYEVVKGFVEITEG